MKQLLIITHDFLAKAYLEALDNFVADTNFISCFAIDSKSSLEEIQYKINQIWNKDDVFIMLTELSLASSTKVAVNVAKSKSNMYVISGMNMMMLLQFALKPLEDDIPAYIKRITADAQADIRYWQLPKGGL